MVTIDTRTNSCPDLSQTPRRYLRREWKRNKPHLIPSDSLPVLRIYPTHRPLFTCNRCGFSNTFIPLCLWCEWTSIAATKAFEKATPRPRRLSAPCLRVTSGVVSGRDGRRHGHGHATCRREPPLPRRMSTTMTMCSSAGPVTPQVLGSKTCLRERQRRHVDDDNNDGNNNNEGTTAIENVDNFSDLLACDAAPAANVQMMKRTSTDSTPIIVDALDPRQVATTTTITPPLFSTSDKFSDATAQTHKEGYKYDCDSRADLKNGSRLRRRLPALCLSTRLLHRGSSSHNRSDATARASIESPRSPRCTNHVCMLNDSHMHSTLSVSSSSQCSPTRTLRRTKQMMLLKHKSSLSVDDSRPRSRPSSPLRESIDIGPTSAIEARQSSTLSFALSQDSASAPVRLGHPSRPYYSAIRKNMSRPSSPAFSVSTPRTPSPIPWSHLEYTPRETKSLDGGERSCVHYACEPRATSMDGLGQGLGGSPFSGFSFSGETELRMYLAQWRREEAPDEPGEYLFHEMGRGRGRMNVKGKMKKFSKGLKELVFGRS